VPIKAKAELSPHCILQVGLPILHRLHPRHFE